MTTQAITALREARDAVPRKAYIVAEIHGDYSEVVFARFNAEARRNGASWLDRDWDEVECKRAPEFDEYADAGEVPVEVLLKRGWYWGCMTCGDPVYADDIANNGALYFVAHGVRTGVICRLCAEPEAP